MDFQSLAQFQPKQLEAWNTLFDNRCKYLLYGGAAHGGKSYFLRWAALGLTLYYAKEYGTKGVQIGLFSEDYPTLKDRQIIRVQREFPSFLGELREFRDEGFAFKLKPQYGDGVILFRNLDDPSKYMSTEFAAELVEELTRDPKGTFEDLRFRLRYPGIKDVKFVAATNPGGIGHTWVKQLWIQPDPETPDKEQDRFFFVRSTVYDNKFTQPEYIKQLQSLPEQKKKAWLEGSWDIFEGQVLSEWSDLTHVVKPFEIPKEWRRYIAMDWGSNKPFSVGWYATNYDGRTYLYRELYMNGLEFEEKFGAPLTARRLARIVLETTKKAGDTYEYCVADPSMWNKILLGEKTKDDTGESYAEIMIDEGLNMLKGDNDRVNGMARYREALAKAPDGKPWYQVFENCYDTIRTIPALVYDENRVEDVDCFVKGTLISTPLGDKKVEDIKVGDLVTTPIGNRKTVKAGISGNSETVVEVTLSNGKKLKGTANHKIFIVNKGLVMLKHLKPDDILMVQNTPLIKYLWLLNKLFTRALSIVKAKVENTTDQVELISKKGIKNYIGRYISTILERFQKDTTYIIKTIIVTITNPQTYSPFLNWNTQGITIKSIITRLKKRSTSGKRVREVKKYYGTTQKRCEKILPPENKSVEIVKLLLRQNTLQKYFVKSVEYLKGCIKPFVPNAIKNFYRRKMEQEQPRPVHIVAVGNYEKERVYRLTIEEAHLYYANGVLVTNTDGEDHCYDRDRYYFMTRPAQSVRLEKPKSRIQRLYLRKTQTEEGGDPLDEYETW